MAVNYVKCHPIFVQSSCMNIFAGLLNLLESVNDGHLCGRVEIASNFRAEVIYARLCWLTDTAVSVCIRP